MTKKKLYTSYLTLSTIDKLKYISKMLNIPQGDIIEHFLNPIKKDLDLHELQKDILTTKINNTIETTQTEPESPPEPEPKTKTKNKKTPEPIKTDEERKEEIRKLNIRNMKETHIKSIYGDVDVDVDTLPESYFKTMAPIPNDDELF